MVVRKPTSLFGALLIMLGVWAAVAASMAHATVPPLEEKLYECRTVTAENRLEPPPPIWQSKGEPEPPASIVQADALAKAPCPAGEIAYPKGYSAPHGGRAVKLNGEIVAGSAAAEAYRQNTDGPNYTPEGSPNSVSPDVGENSENYRYVSMNWVASSIGGGFKVQVAEPHVDEHQGGFNTHSIAQLAYASGPNNLRTVELGWDVEPKAFSGDKRAHLFTFVNRDGYDSKADCYDCEFVPLEGAQFYPGQVLEPTSIPIEFAVEYKENNWWVYVYNQWIGYLKGSFWNNEFTHPSEHAYYGEMYSEEPGYPIDAMGNGLFGESEGSIKMSSPYHLTSTTSAATETLATAERFVSNSNYYTYGRVPVGENEWHFGGPGGAPINMGSVYAYGLCINVENSSLAPGALIRNDACAINHPSQEWLRVVEPGGPAQLIDKNSHLCLWAPESEGRFKQEECHTPSEAGREEFSFVPVQNGGIKWHIVNKANAKCVFTPEGGQKIYPAQRACGPATNTTQLWELY